jgi:hypothetical protein
MRARGAAPEGVLAGTSGHGDIEGSGESLTPLYDAVLAALTAAADEAEATLADPDLSQETCVQIFRVFDVAERQLFQIRMRADCRGEKLFRKMVRDRATT